MEEDIKSNKRIELMEERQNKIRMKKRQNGRRKERRTKWKKK